MKTTLASHYSSPPPRTRSAGLPVLALATLLVLAGGSSPVSAAALRLTNTGPNTEALPTFRLDWDATSNATYLVQSANSLAPGTPWSTLDLVQPIGPTGSYPLAVTATGSNGLSSPPATFYRLVLPQPQIFSVEPAIVAPGVPVDFYVLGQSIPTNALLQINGVTQSGTVYSNSATLVQPAFTPAVAGTYQVSLVIGGVVVSSFNVVCADPLANPELVLQGPPQNPPASPCLATKDSEAAFARMVFANIGTVKGTTGSDDNLEGKKDFKGHVTLLKAFDDGSDGESARTHTKTGHVTLMKAFDDGAGDAEAKKDFKGHVTLLKAFDDGSDGESSRTHTKTGHVTLMKAFDDGSDDARMGGSGDPDRPIITGQNGVMPFSGEVQECDVDLAIPGRGLDFVWARNYHSRIGRFGAAANGWTFSYDVRCAQNASGGMDVYDGTGRKDTYTPGTNGLYTCPEFFREGTLNGGVFRLTFADTGYWEFNPFDGTATAGKLAHIVDRNGNTISLGYDTSGRLAQVVDDLGRTNTMSYNSSGQLASVNDFTGRSVTYQYYQGVKGDLGGAGDLKSVTSPPVTGTPNSNDFPDGKTTTYTYSKSFPLDRENHLLLTVTDPKGQTAAVFSYEHSSTSTNYLRCIAAQEGTNTPSCFNWVFVTRPAGSYATLKCIANDPVGNVTECFFDARNRCVIERDYTGRATPGLPVTDTVNRPTGQLRETDPIAWMRAWSWNNDSLCTSEISPGGQQMQYVYQSDFDPTTTARKRADCRVAREVAASAVDLDGDGVADVTDRSWHFDYDPRFGSPSLNPDYGYSYAKRAAIMDNQRKDVAAIKTYVEQAIAGGSAMYVNPRSIARQQYFFSQSCRLLPTVNKRAAIMDGVSVGYTYAKRAAIMDSQRKNVAAIKSYVEQAVASASLAERLPSLATDPYSGSAFVTSVTDPRGNVTTGTYDTKGNRVKVQFFWDRQSAADLDFAYNSNGLLTAITNLPDANGHRSVDTFTYYTNGPQTGYLERKIEDDVIGITTSYEYDARGNVTRVIDPRTNDWLYTYNALDECVQSQSALLGGGGGGAGGSWRVTTQYAYDANDNFVQRAAELRDAGGNLQGSRTDNFQYDGLDRLSEIALAVDATHALTNRFVYDGNDQCVQVLGGDAVSGADPHQTVAYQYDERDLLFHEITAGGSSLAATNEFSYDANGNTARVNKIEAIVVKQITFTRDGFDRLASVTDPMGNQAVYFHDANDNLKVVRQFGEMNDVPGSAGNIRLAESDYQYDGLDRCVLAQDMFFNPATQSPIGSGKATTTFAYAPNSECVSVTDTLGHTTSYGYDTACRPVSVTLPLPSGNLRSVVYDAGGNPLVEISSEVPAAGGSPQVFAITNVFDSLNRCVSRMDSAGNTSRSAYDSLDRCVQTIDPRGISAFYSYDYLDRCTLAVGDLNGDGIPDFTHDITTTYSWSSSSGNLLAVTDSQTNTTSYAYDSLGRCLTVTHADGTQEQMTWDPRSNLIGEQDANGTTITNTYDLCNRIVHRDIAARNVLATTTFETFTYDGCDRLSGAANDSGTNVFAYDSLDDCVSETQNGLTTTSTYDALGNRLSLTYPGGRALTYTYDALNRCASISDSGQQLVSYAYDGPDRISQITCGNGTKTQIAYDGFAGTPNAQGDYGLGQIKRIRHSVVASGAVIDDRTFGYDPDQNKTARNVTSPVTIGGVTPLQSFQYDPACRLITTLVTTNGAVARLTTYGLDRMGNRTNVTGAASCSGVYSLSSLLPPGDFQMNRYTTTPCDSRTYDNNGNLVSIISPDTGPRTYQRDYADRLVQVEALDSGTGTLAPVASYAYDALGRRVAKSVYAGGVTNTTQFLYDGVSMIEERNGTTTMATYVCADGVRDGTETDVAGGTCLSMNRGGQNYYLHTDDQGNVLALSGSTGGVVERYDYDDYGAVTFLTSDGYPSSATSSAVGNVYLWNGLRLDAETGLQNDDGGSYFEPQTGREFRGTPHVPVLPASLPCGSFGNNPWSGGNGNPKCMKGDFSRGIQPDRKRG